MRFQQGRSLKWQLAQLILGIIVPALTFAGILLWQFSISERNRVEGETQGLSREFAVALDREINGVLTTLQALATSPSIQSRDFATFYKQASEVSRLQGINISLRDTSGHAVFTTRAPFGSDVAVPPILARTDQEVLHSGTPLVSNIFTSTVAGRPVFQIVAAPISVEGKPTYFLGASIEVGYLAEAVRREHLPVGWFGAIVDRNGIFVARTEHHEKWAGKLSSADYRRLAVGDGGSFYIRNSEGKSVLVGYARSTLTGWTAAASLPTNFVDAPLRLSILLLGALGLCLAFIATLIALIMSRRLAMAFDRLGLAASMIGTGQLVEAVNTPVAEINRVGSALQTAAQQLRDRARERDAAETALRELNETLEERVVDRTRERNRLWNSTNDLVAICDSEGFVREINPAWDVSLGWSHEDIVAKPVTDVIESDQSPLQDFISRFDEVMSPQSFASLVASRAGDLRTIMWSVVPDQEKKLFYIVGRDLTEQRRTEAILRQSQKMEAVGQLTGGIAHDFNNMLAVIMGSLNLLERRMSQGNANVSKYIESALDGARRAAELTKRLLAFSRQQPLSPEVIDPNRMVAGMTDLLTRTLGEQNRVQTVLSAGLWRATADPSQIENVILNLAVNARDAMPAGGNLTIETANAYLDEEYARENGTSPGQYVLIAVSDTGCGMTPEIIAKAFDPFFTTKDIGHGTGLGLSQVFGVAKQSNGHVKIYSEVDHGTTIKLYLPRSYAAETPVAGKKVSTPVRGGHADEIILVVEDEERVRNFTVDALRDLGYTVIHASSGPQAKQMMDAGQEVSLLFTDVVMPEMTGRQLVDAMMVSRPHLKVLYMTGYSRNAIVHNGVLDPGTRLLVKPYTMDQLASAVREALEQ